MKNCMIKGELAVTAFNTQQPEITLDHLTAYHKLMLDNGDRNNASKMVELYQKRKEGEIVISFAGHFSAGKSSMVNAILDKNILPKSPIPTSANIVKIMSGKGTARVFFHHGEPVEYQEPYDVEMIKEFGKDRDTIKRMELSTSESLLPNKSAIVDTPGIDAAEDADRLMTESSLHLVDILFYVMDYNHVQSEVNLYFLKSIQDLGIPFYIVINQVDKHEEAELSFANFELKINNTLHQWDIIPCSIYFSSLLDDAHPYNQFPQIKKKVFSLLEDEEKSIMRIDRSVQTLAEAHKQFLNRDYDAKTAHLDNDFSVADQEKLQEINSELESLLWVPQETSEFLQSDLQTTLKNAYLMPADLRDEAELFLVSRQRGFKVGVLRSKRKTARAKEKRINTFLQALQKSMEASIEWKIRDKFINRLKENNITDPKIMNEVQQLKITYTAEDLLHLVNPGAKVNGHTVLNYTNDVSDDIKKKFKDQAYSFIDRTVKFIQANISEQVNELTKQRDLLEKTFQKYKEAVEHKDVLQKKLATVDKLWTDPETDERARQMMQASINATSYSVKQGNYIEKTAGNPDKTIQKEERNSDSVMKMKNYSMDYVTQTIDQTIQVIESLPGFQSFVKKLRDKQQRLAERNLTIALFGAFSAGKSSFANALLGKSLLPSSPNPTTAVINRITPVTDQHVHGTVIIQLKDEATLESDLQALIKRFSPEEADFPTLLDWVESNKLQENNALSKLYQAYLQAMIDGYEANKDYIGKQMKVTLNEFADFVTDETKACYMETIDLYYDCSLTQQGITLVDTPGADSVNARHTSVAFDYIKYADAILYVTYYNHALSRADKDFLLQLGRVKEAFELDKMFFIINAADLAESKSDLQLVENYVEEQLIDSGIRFPKIFPVSSKLALQNKQGDQILNKKMAAFEATFYQFIKNDLSQLTMESAVMDVRRVHQALTNHLDTVHLNEQEKQQYEKTLLHKQKSVIELVENIEVRAYEIRIRQKIEKQLYYVKERLAIRFHDMFKEMFNPTTITASGKKSQEQLQHGLMQLLDYAGYELLQELRAVSLRLEAYVVELWNEVYKELNRQVQQMGESFILPTLQHVELETPRYEQAFTELGTQSFSKTLGRFKGTKAFFAGNEKEKMKDEIYALLEPLIDDYININESKMAKSYQRQWRQLVEKMKQETTEAIEADVKNYLSLLTDTTDVKMLQDSRNEISDILEMEA